MSKNQSTLKRGAGALVEVGLAVALVAMLMPLAIRSTEANRQAHDAATLASDLKSAAAPFASYVNHNYQALMNLTGPGNSLEIPVSGSQNWNGIGDLQHSQYFPESFTGSLPNFQKIRFVVYQVPMQNGVPAHLATMIAATGGNPMTDLQVRQAAQLIGASGGAIPRKPLSGQPQNTILGTYGSWSIPVGQINVRGLTAGHVVMNTDMNTSSSALSDFLNRYWTGNPEANRMHTWIDMNGQGLANTQTIDGVNNNDVFIGDGSHQNNLVVRGGGQIDENRGLTFVSYNGVGDAQEGIASAQIRRDGRWLLLAGENGIVGLRGNLAKFNQIGLYGLEPDAGYPPGWVGGVHTWDVYAESSIGVGHNGGLTTTINQNGDIWGQNSVVSGRLGLTNLKSVQAGSPCVLDAEIPYADSVSGNSPAGVLAPLNDGSGNIASCTDGHWTPLTGSLPYKMQNNIHLPYTNNSSKPVFAVMQNQWWNCGMGKKDNPDWYIYINGIQVCHEENDANSHWESGYATCSAIIPPYATATVTGTYGCSISAVVYQY